MIFTKSFLTVVITVFQKIFEMDYKHDLQHESKILYNRLSIIQSHRVHLLSQSHLVIPLIT